MRLKSLGILSILLCLTLNSYSQSISSPSRKTFLANTTSQDVGAFVISGFSGIISVNIGIENHVDGVTLSLNTTTGLTLNSGYSSFLNFERLSFTGNLSDVNNALASMKIDVGSFTSNIKINVTCLQNSDIPTDYYFNASNKHFYKFIYWPNINYTDSKTFSLSETFKGQNGYLVNITSANENSFLKDIVLDGSDPGGNSIWLGHTDNITEGRWIIETGPESGTVFWEASCVNNPIDYPSGCPVNSNYSDAGTSINERYNHWNSGEPNNSDASNGENLLEFQRGGGWNDLNELNVFSIDGYVVEFSGNFTGVYSASVLSIPTPIISISTPLAQLTSNCAGIPSVDYTTFDINGLNLTSAVNVSAPSGFEISTVSNTSYASSLSLSPISNSVSSTIFIRLSSSATTNGASGTITATSSGATTTTTTISSTPVGSPSFVEPGTYLICSEGTYSVSITTSNYSNGWSVSSPNISVNSTGYVTAGTITGTYTLTYTDACAQSISRNVIVNNSNNAPAITYGQASYKISNSNPQPQGPTANIYVGYNGFNYYSATQPTNTGFYKANNQSGSSAGCPYPFYIFRCTTCPD